MRKIFVCTGNTCRSSLAESYANTRYENEEFESRGLMVTSDTTSSQSIDIIERESLLLPAKPEQLTEEDTKDSLLLVMSMEHKRFIEQRFGEADVKLISEFADGSMVSVQDPIGGDSEQYDRVFHQLKSYIDKFDL